MNTNFPLKNKYLWYILPFFLLAINLNLRGQNDKYLYYYRVYFSDKGENSPSDYKPTDLLSPRAIARRQKAGINVPDIKDIPVSESYMDQIKMMGLTLHCTSKWMNTALFKSETSFNTGTLSGLPFVTDIKTVKSPAGKNSGIDKLDVRNEAKGESSYDLPVTMLNGDQLHASGYKGKGILIAVLDAGFIYADMISSLEGLRDRKGIKATFDFAGGIENVYDYHNHGTAVLSVLAGKIEGIIQGSAPEADFILLRTEDDESEFPCEEDFWAAGAEYADSAGADIISSSLGYYNFDNPGLNYFFKDMDGNTAFVTRAADIAASKGIVVVCSAGNERNNPWQRIIAPSDGDSVICVGAVDGGNIISSFSSAGPSADGRIKPDYVAMGVSVTVQTDLDFVRKSSGTSFSCPVLSGMTACLMQSVPDALNSEIISALRMSADKYSMPDSLHGYGLPNMADAMTILQDLHFGVPADPFVVWPNPTTGRLTINFREEPGSVIIELFSLSGVKILHREIREFAGRILNIEDLNYIGQGIYILRMITKTGTYTRKIIRINN